MCLVRPSVSMRGNLKQVTQHLRAGTGAHATSAALNRIRAVTSPVRLHSVLSEQQNRKRRELGTAPSDTSRQSARSAMSASAALCRTKLPRRRLPAPRRAVSMACQPTGTSTWTAPLVHAAPNRAVPSVVPDRLLRVSVRLAQAAILQLRC